MDQEILDFSVSFHPCRIVPELNWNEKLFRNLPRFADEFRELASKAHSVPPSMILPLSGAGEGIFMLPRKFKKPAGIFPLFSDYTESFFREQIGIKKFSSLPEDRADADLFIIVNPQNPTGTYFEPSAIMRFARKNPQTTVLVDETFLEMGDQCRSIISAEQLPNILVLRSLTESSGWPSLRAGFFAGEPRLISELKRWVLPWQITEIDSELIRWYYSHQSEFSDSWEIQRCLKSDLRKKLQSAGCTVPETKAPFLLFTPPVECDLRELLLKRGILVRDCRSYNLVGTYRAAPRSESENSRLASAVREILGR